jgi:hypothetical protein
MSGERKQGNAEPDPSSWLGRVAAWVGENAAAATIATLVTLGVTGLVVHLLRHTTPQPLSDQWQEVRSVIAREGWEIKLVREADLRGTGEESTVLGLHARNNACTRADASPSDQVRIYDDINGTLNRSFTFEPAARGCHGWDYQVVAIADLSESGRGDVIGEFIGAPSGGGPGIAVPTIITWKPADQRYAIAPLLVEPPTYLLEANVPGKPAEPFERALQPLYLNPIRLGSGIRSGYAASEVKLASNHRPAGSFLVGDYRITSGTSGESSGSQAVPADILYQRALWHLEELNEVVAAGWCPLPANQRAAWLPASDEPSTALALLEHDPEHYVQSCEAPLTSEAQKQE